MGRIRRTGFEITEERMFWEADPDLPSAALHATLTESTGENEPVAPSTEQHEASVAPPIAEHSLATFRSFEPDRPAAAGVSAQQPATQDAAGPYPEIEPATPGPATIERLGASLPPWALEPDWTSAAPPAGGRPSPRPAVLGSAAVLASVAIAAGALALTGGQTSIRPARPTRVAKAAGSRPPIVLAGFHVLPSSPASSQPSEARGIKGLSGRATRDHRPPAHPVRRDRHRRHRHRRRRTSRRASASTASARMGTVTAGRSAPSTAAATQPVPAAPARPASARPLAAPPARAPSRSSGSSEFNFEQ